jgi:hypothetical protein
MAARIWHEIFLELANSLPPRTIRARVSGTTSDSALCEAGVRDIKAFANFADAAHLAVKLECHSSVRDCDGCKVRLIERASASLTEFLSLL